MTCALALVSQVGLTALTSNAPITISDSTCKTCGNAGYCPIAYKSGVSFNPTWFSCVAGGDTDTRHSDTDGSGAPITYCTVTPTGGFYALVIILPVAGILTCVLLCCRFCSCCAWYKAVAAKQATQPASGQGIMMNPMQPMMMQPMMMAGAPAMGTPMMMVAAPAAPAAAEPRVMMQVTKTEQV